MEEKIFDVDRYAACARRAAAEGAVLLKNDSVLPLQEGAKVAFFGRSLYNYYKSGTGSGGLVNVTHVTDILDAVKESGRFDYNRTVDEAYQTWLEDHPYDAGAGWGQEPWFQEEMPLSGELLTAAAAESETAVIVIGRTAGEDQDNKIEAGSWLLTDGEKAMLDAVTKAFSRTVVLLNVGNIIDMSWLDTYKPSAVLYVWQGGQEGGWGVLDVLDGTVTPCGHLTDTIAASIADYPSTSNYGDPDRNFYKEDIYVGYRYFETFCPDKVLYPFGFGLSYTDFSMQSTMTEDADVIRFSVQVTNTGSFHGREVVQAYVSKPQGRLGQPSRILCGFAKTKDLQPGESDTITISVSRSSLASYDDSGCTGHCNCYVLEAGTYTFYLGENVRDAAAIGSVSESETKVIAQLEEILAPTEAFDRMHPGIDGSITMEPVPLRTISPMDRRAERMPAEIPCTGDQGIRLVDVRDGKASMEDFIAQLSDEDLIQIHRGEGMGSPKVTPGTGGAFGGVTESLKAFGIPIGCCSDGPSGIRMDCGTKAFSLPNGTCLACTFDEALNEELYAWEGLELRKNKIDILLGPGMNIHRNPLNGRNFEYFSEDPLLTGRTAAAQLRGMHRYNVTGTIKHFACNNQEFRRNFVDPVVSQRALREIYLRGFEIAVKEGGAYALMSTYGPLNGIYTAGNYDLLTTLLRKEWGFTGIVMTDWWAKANEEGQPGSGKNTPQIVRAQNDLYMVTPDSASNAGGDRSSEGLANGIVSRSEFQQIAANICRNLIRMPAFTHFLGEHDDLDEQLSKCLSAEDEALANSITLHITDGVLDVDPSLLNTEKGSTNLMQVFTAPRGVYLLHITCKADTDNVLAQLPLSVFQEKKLAGSINLTGADQEEQTFTFTLDPAFMGNFYLKLFFGQSGMRITGIRMEIIKNMEEEITRILGEMNGSDND
ncbi:MAG: glycoside hydrolase family 3 C-terminal domain-containing protein [Eubacteriales bacterium]|nr:glycoside hydrolase family 3 C-terminal domain-containing protein [Eubacteriales bacterium]